MKKQSEKLIVLVAALSSMLLQTITIGQWSLWHDESFSVFAIGYGWQEMFERLVRDVHPPLYYIMLKLWSSVFGTSDMSVRSLSVIATVAVVVTSYYLLKKLFGRMPALWSLIGLVFAPMLVRYGMEARMYPIAALFIVLATHQVVDMIKAKMVFSGKRSAIYVVCITLAMYTHYYAALIVPAHMLLILIMQGYFKNKSWYKLQQIKKIPSKITWKFIGLLGVVGILFAPWVPTLFEQATAIQGGFWIRPVSHESFYSTLTSLLFFEQSYSLQVVSALLGMISVTACLVVFGAVIKREQRARKAYVSLLTLLGVPMVLLFVLSIPLQSTYYDRYFAMYAAFFYGAVGVGSYYVMKGKYWLPIIRYATVAVLLVSLVAGIVRVHTVGDFDGDRRRFTMRNVMNSVNAVSRPGDQIIVHHLLDYFDAAVYNKTDMTIQVYMPYETSGWGNTTLVYERDDIQVSDLEKAMPESGFIYYIAPADFDGEGIPDSWARRGPSVVQGYVKLTLYYVGP